MPILAPVHAEAMLPSESMQPLCMWAQGCSRNSSEGHQPVATPKHAVLMSQDHLWVLQGHQSLQKFVRQRVKDHWHNIQQCQTQMYKTNFARFCAKREHLITSDKIWSSRTYLLSKNYLRITLPNVAFDFGYGVCVTVHLPKSNRCGKYGVTVTVIKSDNRSILWRLVTTMLRSHLPVSNDDDAITG